MALMNYPFSEFIFFLYKSLSVVSRATEQQQKNEFGKGVVHQGRGGGGGFSEF